MGDLDEMNDAHFSLAITKMAGNRKQTCLKEFPFSHDRLIIQ
jgi:hypothetical protein